MEKYSQFRDRGSGVAPFFPVISKSAGIYIPLYLFLFLLRLPFILIFATYFIFFQWLPLGPLFKKALLWIILGIPGVWWIDLQIDGVKKGSLAKKHLDKVPGPCDVIASSFASPIDALYLAAVFDPIFTISYPHTEKIQVVSLLGAISRAFIAPEEYPPENAKLTSIKTIVESTNHRAIVVFPECTTTNGTGIMPLSPSLLTVPNKTKIFPLHLRYAPPDITTPVPGLYFSFLWNLLAKPSHSTRVRIAQPVYNITINAKHKEHNVEDQLETSPKKLNDSNLHERMGVSNSRPSKFCSNEKDVLDVVGESLARLGRVKRVGLTVKDKIKFIELWNPKR